MRYWENPKRKPAKKRTTSSRLPVTAGGSLREYPFLRKFYRHQATISVGIQKFLFFLVLATILYAFVFGDGGAIRILTLRHERASMEQELAGIQEQSAALEKEIELVKTDPFQMEKLGRERYGYVFPGDKVYKIIDRSRTEY